MINTDHETLVPADAPLWMTVSYPGGTGVVNLADPGIRKFSDADFPHWTGWLLVDDDRDTHSQCNSAIIRKLQEEGRYEAQSNGLICCLPFEWEIKTIDARYKWLRTGLPWEQCTPEIKAIWTVPGTQETKDRALMSEEDYGKFKQHAEALCFDSGSLGSGRLWHFEPKAFISAFRKSNWYSKEELAQIYPDKLYLTKSLEKLGTTPEAVREKYRIIINHCLEKYSVIIATRKAHFFGQGTIESGMLSLMIEGSANFAKNPLHASFTSEENGYYNPAPGGYLDYLNGRLGNIELGDGPKFRGRGMKQLTGRENYSKYWGYRGWLDLQKYPMSYKGFLHQWWNPVNLVKAPTIS